MNLTTQEAIDLITLIDLIKEANFSEENLLKVPGSVFKVKDALIHKYLAPDALRILAVVPEENTLRLNNGDHYVLGHGRTIVKVGYDDEALKFDEPGYDDEPEFFLDEDMNRWYYYTHEALVKAVKTGEWNESGYSESLIGSDE